MSRAARADVVVLRVPAKKEQIGQKEPLRVSLAIAEAAPMLEELSRLGRGFEDPHESREALDKKMASFNGFHLRALRRMTDLHSRRYGDGYYLDHDPERIEDERFSFVLAYALYHINTMGTLHDRVKESNDAGLSALFCKTLDSVHAFIRPPFYRRSLDETVAGFSDIQPLLHACLRTASLDSLILSPREIFLKTLPELNEIINFKISLHYRPPESGTK